MKGHPFHRNHPCYVFTNAVHESQYSLPIIRRQHHIVLVAQTVQREHAQSVYSSDLQQRLQSSDEAGLG